MIRVINGEQNNVFLKIFTRGVAFTRKGKPVPKYSSEQSVSCTLFLKGINSTTPWWSVDCGTYVAVKRGASADGRQRLNWWQPCHEFENGPEIVLISSEVPTGVFATFSQFVGGLTGVYVVYILTLSASIAERIHKQFGRVVFSTSIYLRRIASYRCAAIFIAPVKCATSCWKSVCTGSSYVSTDLRRCCLSSRGPPTDRAIWRSVPCVQRRRSAR